MAMEVVDAEQLQLDDARARWAGLARARAQAQQRYEKSGRESGRSWEQMVALDNSHTRSVSRVLQGFCDQLMTPA